MFKRSAACLVLLAAIPALAAGQIRVAVSLVPMEGLVREIGGDHVEVHSLQAEGDSCSVFEPRPSAIAWLFQSDIFFRTGAAFEEAMLPKIHQQQPSMRILDLRIAAGIPSSDTAVAHGEHVHAHDHACEHCTATGDPHIWLDPVKLIGMANFVAEQLSKERPAEAEYFRKRAKTFNSSVSEVHQQLQKQLGKYSGRAFYIYHPALGHFADRYGLIQIAIANSSQGPNARHLHGFIVQAREQGVRAILVQPQESRRHAEIVAGAIGGEVVEINPMSQDLAANILEIGMVLAGTFNRE